MTWLNHDHKQFESTVHRCRSICDDDDWIAVHKMFQDFLSSYEMHVRLEEDVLFPRYEQRVETSASPTESLREDHTQIFRLARHIQDLLEHGDRQDVANDLSLLYRLLTKHHEKEEEIFLPMASETLLLDKAEILSELKSLVTFTKE